MEVATQLPPTSRVWIYQANRILSDAEVDLVKNQLSTFVGQWVAHGTPLNADFQVLNNLFIVLMVDESGQNATGCSIDSSVAQIKDLESKLNITLLDRLALAYENADGEIQVTSMSEFQKKISAGEITPETIVFNNMVENLGDFQSKWRVPASESWHKNLL
jgi:hypothetical protein